LRQHFWREYQVISFTLSDGNQLIGSCRWRSGWHVNRRGKLWHFWGTALICVYIPWRLWRMDWIQDDGEKKVEVARK